MRHPLVKQFEADRDALSRRITMLSQVSLEIEYNGLCGYGFGESIGEEIEENSPEFHRKINNMILYQWQTLGL